jgi:SAM-dependent methyltransferase
MPRSVRIRRHLRELRERPAVVRALRLAFRGDAVACPCCGSEFRRFRSFNGPDRVCWVCGAMERHRVAWLYLDQNPGLLRPGMRIVHVAPERVLRNRFRALPGVEYHAGDLTAEFGPERIDVTALPYDAASVDALVCNHVLEHVPDDRKAMSEIRRVLRPAGWALLQVPGLELGLPATDEDPSVTDPAARLARFGQDDHVRRYGRDYADRLEAAGLPVELTYLDRTLPEAEVERFRLRREGRVEPVVLAGSKAAPASPATA